VNETTIPIGYYVRHSDVHPDEGLPLADIPAWELCRQVIQLSDQDGIKLNEEILATGLTLRKAWAVMVAIANPRKENSR